MIVNRLRHKVFCVNMKKIFCLIIKRYGEKMIDNNVNEKWISIDDAAEHLGVKPVTIRDWIRKGKDIPAHKIGKQWKFKFSELDAWVKSGHSAE